MKRDKEEEKEEGGERQEEEEGKQVTEDTWQVQEVALSTLQLKFALLFVKATKNSKSENGYRETMRTFNRI